jgi:hypothetical protein
MPQKPSFCTPAGAASEAAVTLTLMLRGRASLGPVVSSIEICTAESPRATIVQWKSDPQSLPMARSRTSSG